MELSEIELYRLEKAIRQLCQSRNQNTPAELGKVQYEMLSDGVFVYKEAFLLDSSHVNFEYPVARLILDAQEGYWKLQLTEESPEDKEKASWVDKKNSPTFEPLVDELLHDPDNLFW
ncbi:DUF3024 domain-containing protein [Vibrio sp. JC009]|uniref:DUF3024 domain-containing protein n=1 Tax=Vibrio sp. JC009 TaxID=2912314 RepID=UPI0023B0209D|nr:DUF3024 domain-containing protein [Vibrio sp. JC009]WED24349.1 DUF3024 domain-containing protein [Vibrio sp. JC009]